MLAALLMPFASLSATEAPAPWDASLDLPPATFPAEGFTAPHPGVNPLFYAGPPYQGQPTRVFAYLGIPPVPAGQTVPGIVLIHGGLGTAYADWVKLWMDRGYAAIAMDTCGALPEPPNADPRPRHAHSGPSSTGNFKQIVNPPGDQWPFHAVAAARLAHSLLRTQPGVDPARIGVTGISWGGYLTCLLASTDHRLAFAAPIYGCGFINESVFGKGLRESAPDHGQHWLDLWDPSCYLPSVRCPMLWVNGTNDAFFFPPPWQKSHRLPTSPRTLSLIPGLAHSQLHGAAPLEIPAFADSIVRGGEPLPTILSDSREGTTVTVRFRSPRPLAKADLIYTADTTSPWPDRLWESVPATLSDDSATASLPPAARLYFLNLTDTRGLIVSSEYHEAP